MNWDTFLQTAVSDDEVFQETVKGKFWHFRYPVVKGSGFGVQGSDTQARSASEGNTASTSDEPTHIAQAVAGICLWGTLVGSMLPLVFKRIGVDPGIASSPFVATFVDVTGIIIYFSIAKVLLLP